jgi:hypothetical protein
MTTPAARNLLNAVAAELKTDDRQKVIMTTLALMVKEGGIQVETAYEMIFGEGSWQRLCESSWESLHNLAQAA